MTALATAERLPAPSMPFAEIEKASKAIVPSLFQLKNQGEVLTLMLLGQADGIHPITALRRYHIIEGKPSMKADAMLGCYKEQGGKVRWLKRTDDEVSAEFSHNGESVTITWNTERAQKAGLLGKKNWQSYKCQMLTARVISEGVRLVMPQIVAGIYTPEEVLDFDKGGANQQTWGSEEKPEPKQVEVIKEEPAKPAIDVDAKYKQIYDWILSILDPATFQRNPSTENFVTYKDQILKDGEGLPEDKLYKLRATAYCQFLACMICTTPEADLDQWPDKIKASKLDAQSMDYLDKVLAENRKVVEKGVAA